MHLSDIFDQNIENFFKIRFYRVTYLQAIEMMSKRSGNPWIWFVMGLVVVGACIAFSIPKLRGCYGGKYTGEN